MDKIVDPLCNLLSKQFSFFLQAEGALLASCSRSGKQQYQEMDIRINTGIEDAQDKNAFMQPHLSKCFSVVLFSIFQLVVYNLQLFWYIPIALLSSHSWQLFIVKTIGNDKSSVHYLTSTKRQVVKVNSLLVNTVEYLKPQSDKS